GLPIDPDPGLVERAQTRKQRGACRLCATQRARDGRGHASSVGKLLYPGTQGWVRTDLEESPEAGLDELRYGGREAHRLAHVSAPVDCVEVAGFAPAPGDGRHQGQRRGPWTQCAERTHDAGHERLHLRAVEGVVDGQRARRDTTSLQPLDAA